MKKNLFPVLLLLTLHAGAQNLPACDTLLINCCTFDSVGPSTITLYASNYSSVLFDYPGFIILDASQDTIAKETVTYFGIGQGFQPHTLDIVAPLILPFDGTMELHTLFYTSLACSWPLHLADTVNGISNPEVQHQVKLFPNPAAHEVKVDFQYLTPQNNCSAVLYDVTGRKIIDVELKEPEQKISLEKIETGMYLLNIVRQETVIASGKLVVNK